MNDARTPVPPKPVMNNSPGHRHTWWFKSQDEKKAIYYCRGCPEELIEPIGDKVVNDAGKVGVLVKQEKR